MVEAEVEEEEEEEEVEEEEEEKVVTVIEQVAIMLVGKAFIVLTVYSADRCAVFHLCH